LRKTRRTVLPGKYNQLQLSPWLEISQGDNCFYKNLGLPF
jgi:hypothetical protein